MNNGPQGVEGRWKKKKYRTTTNNHKRSNSSLFPCPAITFCCSIKCKQLISLQLEKAPEKSLAGGGGRGREGNPPAALLTCN